MHFDTDGPSSAWTKRGTTVNKFNSKIIKTRGWAVLSLYSFLELQIIDSENSEK